MADKRVEVVFALLIQNAIRSFFGIESAQAEQVALKQVSALEYEQAYQLLDSKFASLSTYIEQFSVIEYQRIQSLNPEQIDQIDLRKKLLESQKEIASRVPSYLTNNLSKIEISETEEYRWVAALREYVFMDDTNEDNLIENLRQLATLTSVLQKLEEPTKAKTFLKQVYDYYQHPVTNLSRGQLSIAALYGYLQQQKVQQETAKCKILTENQ